MRAHNEAVNRLDVMVEREAITADYAPGTVETVVQHDGSILRLRKLADDYDPSDRIRAMSYLQQRQAEGEIVTGLFYVEPDRATCTNSSTPSKRRSTASAKPSCAPARRLWQSSTPPIASGSGSGAAAWLARWPRLPGYSAAAAVGWVSCSACWAMAAVAGSPSPAS